ncbi:MAG: hypothetical protein AB9917_15715 [Negativicutes bacterium]
MSQELDELESKIPEFIVRTESGGLSRFPQDGINPENVTDNNKTRAAFQSRVNSFF